jgi:hypothetical protein
MEKFSEDIDKLFDTIILDDLDNLQLRIKHHINSKYCAHVTDTLISKEQSEKTRIRIKKYFDLRTFIKNWMKEFKPKILLQQDEQIQIPENQSK